MTSPLLRGLKPLVLAQSVRPSSAARLARSIRSVRFNSASTSTAPSSTSQSSSQRTRRILASGSVVAATIVAFSIYLNFTCRSPVECEPQTRQPTQASSVKGGNDSDLPEISHLDPNVISDTSAPMRKRMETYVKLLQYNIVSALSQEEPKARFLIDSWVRKQGGEGISCVLQDGSTFEKAGVNISVVHGMLPPAAIRQMSADHAGLMTKTGYNLEGPNPDVKGLPFYAAGLSLVVHPKNPFVPTVHFNYRYFEITQPEKLADGSPNPRYSKSESDPLVWWFGGGTDLTPIYLFDEDAKHFHATLKEAAGKHDASFYPTWKKWCDRYFQIPHRGEARGIGGIFFDDLTLPAWASSPSAKSYIPLSDGSVPTPTNPIVPAISSTQRHSQDSLFATVRSLGDAFLPGYLPIVQNRKNTLYTEAHERWQQIRRGRYVEFNLLYDRGTKFGLQTPGARIESILMSLPLKARWEYMEKYSGGGAQGRDGKATTKMDGEPVSEEAEGAEEKKIQAVLRSPKDWA